VQSAKRPCPSTVDLEFQFLAAIRQFLPDADRPGHDPIATLDAIHFHLTLLLANRAQFKLYAAGRGRVLSGPFAGMRMPPPAMVPDLRQLVPVDGGSPNIANFLLGTYEGELHGPIELLLASRSYEEIVDVGCSIGYYAIGLALRQPGAVVHAQDTNAMSLAYVRDMAVLNGVADRVRTGGIWEKADCETLAGRRCLLFCDIEGAEVDLLDPVAVPSLVGYDIIVELHDVFDPMISQTIVERFSASHDIMLVSNGSHRSPLPREIDVLTRHESAAVLSDLRLGRTPWAVMTARHGRTI